VLDLESAFIILMTLVMFQFLLMHDTVTITPFISFDGGYSFTTEEITHGKEPNFHGGPYFNLSLGMKFYTRKTNALAFSFGYNYQQFETSVTEDNFYYPDTKQYWVKEQLEYMAMKFSFVF